MVKYYRGDIISLPKEDTEKGAEIAPIAREILKITGDGLLGYCTIPEDPEEAAKYISREVFFKTPSFGTGENLKNGYNVGLAEAIFEKGREILLLSVEDDAKKPAVRTKLITVPPTIGLFDKRFKFKVRLRYALITKDGERYGWSDPFYTKALHGKPNLLTDLYDLILTRVPSVQVSEDHGKSQH